MNIALSIQSALTDITRGASHWRLWTALAFEDLTTTYRRSALGALWIAISFAAFILVKMVIFLPLLAENSSSQYAMYIAVGFFVWQFISSTLNTAPMTFITAEPWIKNDPIPFSVFIYQSVARSSFDLILTGFVTFIFLIVNSSHFNFVAITSIIAIIFFMINAIWVKMLLGITCARFRDIGHFVNTATRLLLFMTPIFWYPGQMGQLWDYLYWNPIAHFLIIFREPLLQGTFPTDSWIFVIAVTAIGWIIAFAIFAAFRRRIVFWF